MSIDNGKGIIVWQQSGSGNIQTVYSYTDDVTNGFSSNYDTIALQYGANPDVVMNGEEIHVVWRDYSSGSVKYRKGTLSGVGLQELTKAEKRIVKYLDLSGREVSFSEGAPLIVVYEDGSTEQIFKVKK